MRAWAWHRAVRPSILESVDEPIPIKPHHLIDILRDFGRGQRTFAPHPYGHAVHLVAAHLREHRDAEIRIELGADGICAPCVHNSGGTCDDTIDTSFRPDAPSGKGDWNLLLDRRWCQRLGLAPGDRLTVAQFCRRVRRRAGDLRGIYREEPADRTAARAADLWRGMWLYRTGAL